MLWSPRARTPRESVENPATSLFVAPVRIVLLPKSPEKSPPFFSLCCWSKSLKKICPISAALSSFYFPFPPATDPKISLFFLPFCCFFSFFSFLFLSFFCSSHAACLLPPFSLAATAYRL